MQPDDLIEFPDGGRGRLGDLTFEQFQEVQGWYLMKMARLKAGMERIEAGLPPLCDFYNWKEREFCTANATWHRIGDATSEPREASLCDLHYGTDLGEALESDKGLD